MCIDVVLIGKILFEDINVIIEVFVGGEFIKYEMDKDVGVMYVDWFFYILMCYLGNYGFVLYILCGDGDLIDVIVVNQCLVVFGVIMNCCLIGVLLMEDEFGQDEKIIVVLSYKLIKCYDSINDVIDVLEIMIVQVKYFFEYYKDLEFGKWVKIIGVEGVDVVKKLIIEFIECVKVEVGQ